MRRLPRRARGRARRTRAAEWSDRELFWITKHGIKLAGMPAFGITHSDEELWEVVAFVRGLQDMPPDEYRRMLTDAQAHAGMAGTEAQAHAGMPGMETHADMPGAEAQAHTGMPAMEAHADMPTMPAPAHEEMPGIEPHAPARVSADHAAMDHARPDAAPPAGVQAPAHQNHEALSEREVAGAPGPEGTAERVLADPARVDDEATVKLKTLAAELLRDSVVLKRIQVDSALQRRWESVNLRRELTVPRN